MHAATRVVDPVDAPPAQADTLLERVAIQQPQMLYATLGEWFGGLCVVASVLLGLRSFVRPHERARTRV